MTCTQQCIGCPACEGKHHVIPGQVTFPAMSDIDCYNLSQTACNMNDKCFYCISGRSSDNYSCSQHPEHPGVPNDPSNPKIGICDKKNIGACLPISGTEGSYNVDHTGPINNMSLYAATSNYLEVNKENPRTFNGNSRDFDNILEYPSTCKPPIKPVLSYSEMRRTMGLNN